MLFADFKLVFLFFSFKILNLYTKIHFSLNFFLFKNILNYLPVPHSSTGIFSQLVSPANLPGLCSTYLVVHEVSKKVRQVGAASLTSRRVSRGSSPTWSRC